MGERGNCQGYKAWLLSEYMKFADEFTLESLESFHVGFNLFGEGLQKSWKTQCRSSRCQFS